MGLIATLSVNDTWYNQTQLIIQHDHAECRYAECNAVFDSAQFKVNDWLAQTAHLSSLHPCSQTLDLAWKCFIETNALAYHG